MNTAPIFKHINGLRCSGNTPWARGVNAGIDHVLTALNVHLGKDDGYDPTAAHDTMALAAFKAAGGTDFQAVRWTASEAKKWSAVAAAVLDAQPIGRPWNELDRKETDTMSQDKTPTPPEIAHVSNGGAHADQSVTPMDRASQDQMAAVMLQHGTPAQRLSALAYAGQPVTNDAAANSAIDLDLDRALSLADEYAEESMEDGRRILDRGGLLAFAKDLLRIYATPPEAATALAAGEAPASVPSFHIQTPEVDELDAEWARIQKTDDSWESFPHVRLARFVLKRWGSAALAAQPKAE